MGRAKFVIEKLVSELNAQVEANGDYIELYQEEVNEINEAIKLLGLQAKLGGDEQ